MAVAIRSRRIFGVTYIRKDDLINYIKYERDGITATRKLDENVSIESVAFGLDNMVKDIEGVGK